jgi:hypothetical protein
VIDKGVDGFNVHVRARNCTGHGFYAAVSGSKGSVGIVRGYINVPSTGGNAFICRTSGDEVSTVGLKIIQGSNNDALQLDQSGGGTHNGLRAKCTSASPNNGLRLIGCTNVIAVAPDLDGFSHNVLFADHSGPIPTTGCQVLGGRLANATQSDNVLESGTSTGNLVDGVTVVGSHLAVTLVGATSKKRNIIGSGSAVVLEDTVSASVTINAPGAVPGLALASATISYAGAAVTDTFEVTPPAALPANYGPPVAWCPSAGNVQIAYPQWSGAAAAPTGMSTTTTVKRKRLG